MQRSSVPNFFDDNFTNFDGDDSSEEPMKTPLANSTIVKIDLRDKNNKVYTPMVTSGGK